MALFLTIFAPLASPELLHDNVRKFGTIYNTLADGTEFTGTLERARD